MNLEDYVSAPEVIRQVGMHRQAFYKRIRKGQIPCVRVGDRIIMIHKDVIPTIAPDLRSKGGIRAHPLYPTYMNMLRRCYNPKYKRWERYGGRGISVCQEWRDSFEQFCKDMGPKPSPKHSIERENNDGNYEPGNCKWATQQEQMLNTSRSRRS